MRTPGLLHPVDRSAHPRSKVMPRRQIEGATGRPIEPAAGRARDRWHGWRDFSAMRGPGSRATTDAISGKRPAGRGQPEEARAPGAWCRIRDAAYDKMTDKACREGGASRISRLGFRALNFVRVSDLGLRYFCRGVHYLFRTGPMRIALSELTGDMGSVLHPPRAGILTTKNTKKTGSRRPTRTDTDPESGRRDRGKRGESHINLQSVICILQSAIALPCAPAP